GRRDQASPDSAVSPRREPLESPTRTLRSPHVAAKNEDDNPASLASMRTSRLAALRVALLGVAFRSRGLYPRLVSAGGTRRARKRQQEIRRPRSARRAD